MKLSDLNEAMIRGGGVSPEILKRGEDYWRRGAVQNAVLRGDKLTAEVEGSDYEPYEVTIRLGSTRIASAECTCPYGDQWEGWCKHIVATLLLAIHNPEEVEEATPIADLLKPLSIESLKAIILRIAESDPHFANQIAEAAAEAAPVVSRSRGEGLRIEARPSPPVDAAGIRRQVKSAIRSLDRMSGSDAYWHVGGVVKEILNGPVRSADVRLSKGDIQGALATIEATMSAYLAEWMNLDGSDGDTPEPFYEMGRIAAEAFLTASDISLSPTERRDWVRKMNDWENEIGDYGVDDAFSAAIEAAEEGWDDPDLQRVLSGESDHLENTHGPYYSGYAARLSDVQINILEKSERYEEAFRLATATKRLAKAVALLVRLGRTKEAVDLARRRAETTDDALEMAQALDKQDDIGAREAALTIGEMGLDLPQADRWSAGGRGALAVWLRDAASLAKKQELFRRAALAAVRALPNLDNWKIAEKAAGPSEWPKLRDEMLTDLRRPLDDLAYGSADTKTEIFLHERCIDDALKMIPGISNKELVARVADAALTERPEAVLTLSRRKAEGIMDEGKSGLYEDARDWLRRYRDALAALNRSAEWPPYRDALLEKHKRRHKLVPLIRALG